MSESTGARVSVDRFLQGLQAIPEAKFTVPNVLHFLRENPVEPGSLDPYVLFSPTHYTRNLVFRCGLFELMTICWEIGQVSRIHNHSGQNCWMAASRGRLVVQNYDTLALDEALGHCRLAKADRFEMTPGDPGFVQPERPIHAVLNPREFGERAVSLHLYSRPYDSCRVYSLEGESFKEAPLFFDTEFGRAAQPQDADSAP